MPMQLRAPEALRLSHLFYGSRFLQFSALLALNCFVVFCSAGEVAADGKTLGMVEKLQKELDATSQLQDTSTGVAEQSTDGKVKGTKDVSSDEKVGPWSRDEFLHQLQRAEEVYQRHVDAKSNLVDTKEELLLPMDPSTLQRMGRLHLDTSLRALDVYQKEYMILPRYPCFEEERIGRWGDGGKWICWISLHKPGETLTVYSVGSNGDSSFEESVFQRLGAKPHTFDPTLRPDTAAKMESLSYLHFHRYGLGVDTPETPEASTGSGTTTQRRWLMELKGIKEIMTELNHSFIDLLKVDCEGCEVGFVAELGRITTRDKPLFGQLLLEVHQLEDMATESRVLTQLRDLGFRMFHQEPNFFGLNKACEVAFIHEMFTDLQ